MSSSILGFISFVFAAFASVAGIWVVEPWEQVLTLWSSGINPLPLFGHPHMPRYFVVYPGFLLGELLAEIGFSLYLFIFFAFNVTLLNKISLLASQRRLNIVTYLSFVAMHLAMNGRAIIAWTSWLICILICYKISKRISHPAS